MEPGGDKSAIGGRSAQASRQMDNQLVWGGYVRCQPSTKWTRSLQKRCGQRGPPADCNTMLFQKPRGGSKAKELQVQHPDISRRGRATQTAQRVKANIRTQGDRQAGFLLLGMVKVYTQRDADVDAHHTMRHRHRYADILHTDRRVTCMSRTEMQTQIHVTGRNMQMWVHFMQRDADLGNIMCREMQTEAHVMWRQRPAGVGKGDTQKAVT